MGSIELRCSICPLNPTFSDQSHLLTHIGSKGHLSHYFKAQVRSRQDSSMRDRLFNYDAWYTNSNIDKLLSQRLMMKESKRSSRKALTRSTGSIAVGSRRLTRKPRNIQGDVLEGDQASMEGNEFIDPNLDGVQHSQVALRIQKPDCSGPHEAYTDHSKIAPMARMRLVPGIDCPEQHASPMHRIISSRGEYLPADKRLSDADPGSARHEKERKPSFLGHSSLHLASSSSKQEIPEIDSSWTVPQSHEDSIDEWQTTEKPYRSESSKLKGVIWPGMNLFDTADEDSKRKRNQKKNNSTLIQMQAESESVEQTELIYFYPSWDLKQARFISGEVDSSPPRELTPKSKVGKPRKPRVPLTDLNPNAANNKQRHRFCKAPRNLCKEKDDVRYGLAEENVKESFLGEQLAVLGAERARQRGFTVFQDATGETTPAYGRNQPLNSSVMFQDSGAKQAAKLPNQSQERHPLPVRAHQAQEEEFGIPSLLGSGGYEQWLSNGQHYPRGLQNSSETHLRRGINPQCEIDSEIGSTMSLRHGPEYVQAKRNYSPSVYTNTSAFMDFAIAHDSQPYGRSANPLASSFFQTLQSHESSRSSGLYEFGDQAGPSNGYCFKQHKTDVKRQAIDYSSGDETIDQGVDDGSMLFD